LLIKYIKIFVATFILFVATPQQHTPEIAYADEPIQLIEIVELKSNNPEVEIKIRAKALEYGLNPNTMVDIAIAESGQNLEQVWNYRYEENPNYYTAFGIFQIVSSTYESFCGDPDERFDIDKNIECGMIIASESGKHHWNESKSAWSIAYNY
jgi:hypothetical protein